MCCLDGVGGRHQPHPDCWQIDWMGWLWPWNWQMAFRRRVVRTTANQERNGVGWILPRVPNNTRHPKHLAEQPFFSSQSVRPFARTFFWVLDWAGILLGSRQQVVILSRATKTRDTSDGPTGISYLQWRSSKHIQCVY